MNYVLASEGEGPAFSVTTEPEQLPLKFRSIKKMTDTMLATLMLGTHSFIICVIPPAPNRY